MESDLKIIEINCNEILPNRFQPRITYDELDLLELSDSIKKYGLIQPIIVRKLGKKYEIIIGERRYKASILAGLEKIPVIIRDINGKESFEISLVENVQRKNLSPIEEALAYKKVITESSLNIEDFSKKIGKTEDLINSKIKLLSLSDKVQESLINNEISERHARSLLKLNSKSEQNYLLKKIISERLNVKSTEEEIDKIKGNKILNKKDKEEQIMNNDTNFMFNTSEEPKTFDIFETNNLNAINNEKVNDNIFSTEPSAPTFINNNTPMFTQIPNNESNNIEIPTTENPKEPMFVLFDDENSTSPIIDKSIPEDENTNELKESETLNTTDSNLNVFETFNTEENNNVSNVTINANNPEKSPIIISDYGKQYDPVMPQTEIDNTPKVDMRSIINMIRNCQKEIEKAGYIIELDEYDLADSYQVTFKIEKK